jgi:hypothetical protein
MIVVVMAIVVMDGVNDGREGRVKLGLAWPGSIESSSSVVELDCLQLSQIKKMTQIL